MLESKVIAAIVLLISTIALGFVGMTLFARAHPNAVKRILQGIIIGNVILCICGIFLLL